MSLVLFIVCAVRKLVLRGQISIYQVSACICVCMSARARARVCVCVCVRVPSSILSLGICISMKAARRLQQVQKGQT